MTRALGLVLLLSGCVVVQKVDTAIDCHGVCSRYQSCFESTYDVSACELRCRDASSTDGDYRRKADMCNACISERSCASATFACVVECAAIVP
ncbi:MAG: hypothetical protein H6Q89_1058 [Myxococcaceae bacterium]|nr:hypothetical protein [Myxococcaceae bacterium]